MKTNAIIFRYIYLSLLLKLPLLASSMVVRSVSHSAGNIHDDLAKERRGCYDPYLSAC